MTDPSHAHAGSAVASDARAAQCRTWNATRTHHVAAGKARAAQMTPKEWVAFGHAAFAAFSACFRAVQGLLPLSAAAARRYLTPRDIRRLGMPIASPLAETIHRAWCAGQLFPVSAWLSDDPPADPHGLWVDDAAHTVRIDPQDGKSRLVRESDLGLVTKALHRGA
jgi:hypothetical protein